jgi:hypothetical protein
MIELTEQDLTDITVVLVRIIMLIDVEHQNRSRYGELHDKIQIIRRKNGTFVSVDSNEKNRRETTE